ncbi:MAG: histone deacetylase [Planctomycetes bacterium]|nr:histone deacetylase [Planctomycetota bacterium]
MFLDPLRRAWRRWRARRGVPVFHHSAYRLPLPSLEGQGGIEPRRADFAAWYLMEQQVVATGFLIAPPSVSYAQLGRVHPHDYLESLTRPETLARIFAVDPTDLPVDETLNTVRLACGGTLQAARGALRFRRPMLNLLGGFHHAGPASGGGMCPVNDIAVAVAAVRAEGLRGRVAILDLDAHPPDGTALCLRDDPEVWIGSLSGCEWGPMERVDETVLPEGTTDEPYLAALAALLGRMPQAELAFVLAGGDVLAGDRLGKLGLTLDGARRRDLAVAEALRTTPSVWVPAGGRHPECWKVLAGTGLALAGRGRAPIPADYDPLGRHLAAVSATLSRSTLSSGGTDFTADDIAESLGLAPAELKHLLGYYTAAGIEYGLGRMGILEPVERLGYENLHVAIDEASPGHRLRLLGTAGGREHALIEVVLEKKEAAGERVLFVHWLTLRHPLARFSDNRPRLPGQEVPGLGLAREINEVLPLMAKRLGLAGVAFQPAWYHIAYAGRYRFRFVDPARQGRFEALVRDLAGVPLLEATLAVAAGRVQLNGAPYAWEADTMVAWLAPPAAGAAAHSGGAAAAAAAAVAAAREATHFSLLDAGGQPGSADRRTDPRGSESS